MRRIKSGVLLLILSLLLVTTTCVHVYGLGTLRIDPYWPYMSGTEEEFHVWIEGSGTAYEPKLFLAMTETCYANLAIPPGAAVEIDFFPYGSTDAIFLKSDFSLETDNGVKIPLWAEEGVQYTVASLKSHLESDDPIRWWDVPFPVTTTINGDGVWFKIKLYSSQPKMLVYVFGKTDDTLTNWNIKVPPTIPGFMVPEPATIAAVATPMLALLTYAYYKRKTIFS